ncbi:MAG TPA: FAD-binding protein [Verrucomicrobiae bacterium]
MERIAGVNRTPSSQTHISNNTLTRRRMLGLIGPAGMAAVIGFDVLSRHWVTLADTVDCANFTDVPTLDGELLLDDATRGANSVDKGMLVQRMPCAVLRPGSVSDISKMIHYCRKHNLKVATRGQAHTMFGQSLSPGLVIENASLGQIHSIGPDGADVDAGVRWKDLIIAAYQHGLTPPVLTGYTNLSIGGTLSVGGVSARNNNGAQVDHVQELEVVTGVGYVQKCSATKHSDLFNAVLAGLGQCGVITRAKVDLVPVKPLVRVYVLRYTDNAKFFSDLRTLAQRGEMNECFNVWFPGPTGTEHKYEINAAAYYGPGEEPNDAHLMRGLTMPVEDIVVQERPYLDHVLAFDFVLGQMQQFFGWDYQIKPWYDVYLPDSTVEQNVGEVMGGITAQDVGPLGFVLIFPLRRSRFTRPLFRLPEADGSDWVYLFDVLTVSGIIGQNEAYANQMLTRNRTWFEAARQAGATLYPIGAMPMGREEWAEQYGPVWGQFRKWKQKYDPNNVLAPGAGIF